MTILFGLLAAIFSGTGDFLGGSASRHGRVTAVALQSHMAGIVATLILAPIVGGSPTGGDLAWGAAAGVCGGFGILMLYTGFIRSDIAVVSPIAAVGAAGFPVAFALATGDRPSVVTSTGIAVGFAAIWMISRGPAVRAGASTPVGVVYGIGAGFGFGWLLVFLGQASAAAGIWPLAPARAAGFAFLALVAVVSHRELIPHRRSIAPLAVAGTATIVGNGAFIIAAQHGSLAVASVLAAMFPATTVVLARLTLDERLTRARLAGLATALLAVCLVSVG